jgi:hypothetical protein
VIAIDPEYDIGLLKIENPRPKTFVAFTTDPLPVGTEIGAIGFPLMDAKEIMNRSAVPMLRFQGGHVSANYSKPQQTLLVAKTTSRQSLNRSRNHSPAQDDMPARKRQS